MNRNLDNKNFLGIVLIIMVLMVFFPGSVPCQRVKEVYPDLVERINSPENGRLDIYWVDASILEKEGGAF